MEFCEVLFDRQPNKGERVFEAKVADNVSAALEPIASYSNGHALYDPSLGSRPSASKTGTAQLGDTGQNKDAWMVGYTPQLSTAVWVGTDEGTAITNYVGSSIYGSMLPSDIWQSTMDAALDGVEEESFPKADEIGGYAGVPQAPPPPTSTTPPTPTETVIQPSIEVAPGITIPVGPPTTVPLGPAPTPTDPALQPVDPAQTTPTVTEPVPPPP